MTKISDNLSDLYLYNRPMHNLIMPFKKSIDKLNSSLSKQITQSTSLYLNSLDISNSLSGFKEILNKWNNQMQAVSIFVYEEYGYFISPNASEEIRIFFVEVLKQNMKKREVDAKFYKLYSKNNWKNLNFINKWSKSYLLTKRLPAIKAAISILRFKKRNSYKVILPLLITQINGILIDLAKENNISLEVKDKKGKLKPIQDGDLREIVLCLIKQNIKDYEASLAVLMIERVLFGKGKIGIKIQDNPYGFNRHKILHGEDLTGLTRENMIRAFLLLDFLSQLLIN